MSTRFILIELEEPSTIGGIAKALSICELPTAEELGRVALAADDCYESDPAVFRKIGEAILARIKGKLNA